MPEFSKDKLTPPEDSGLPIQEEVQYRMTWLIEMAKTESAWKEEGESEELNRWIKMFKGAAIQALITEFRQAIEDQRVAKLLGMRLDDPVGGLEK